MGAKGTSVNVTDLAATYVVLKGMIDQVDKAASDIRVRVKSIQDTISEGSIDQESSDMFEDLFSDLTQVVDSIQAGLEVILKLIDKGLQTSSEVAKTARAQANTVRENIQKTGSRLKR